MNAHAKSETDEGLFSSLRRTLQSRRRAQESEEQIKLIVDDADDIIDDKKRMIGEILDLDELDAADVMTPRVDMITVEDTETARMALDRMMGTGYSRLPVFHDNLDQIAGVVHLKDLIAPALEGQQDEPAARFMAEAYFIPESKDLFTLLREMQTNRQQMALVVDEYGGTDGLITIEDIVEEIVGEIIDETDSEHCLLSQVDDGEWIVDGRLPVDDARALGWPVEESENYDTIAGWFMDRIDAVPQVGRELVEGGTLFRVENMRRRRIKALRVIANVGAEDPA
ncbi:HlyC/CorC family transporter [Berryella wangjianweii]|uniref:HlyC/CorC family transporter n=1 Tax=Berryella wangjianweii TaxID=2734634 RepID=A0A6M8IY11_9ACTN|nr:hemolysin family protein [Berryella wangjianweii]QKF07745.1 HlyC/CorC family transporter [Berryella wangjianweii]